MKKNKIHMYAIIRIDDYQSDDEDRVTVKKIVLTIENAENEVKRLNKLKEGKRSKYFWQTTRLEVNEQLIEAIKTQYESFE